MGSFRQREQAALGPWSGASDFFQSLLVQRRIQMIHVPLRYLLGFTLIFPFKADRFEWIDALDFKSLFTLQRN